MRRGLQIRTPHANFDLWNTADYDEAQAYSRVEKGDGKLELRPGRGDTIVFGKLINFTVFLEERRVKRMRTHNLRLCVS